MKKSFVYILIVIAFILGAAVGCWWATKTDSPTNSALSKDVRDQLTRSQFTNPLLECSELPETISIGDRLQLQKDVESFITTQKKNGVLSDAAVYFRDLNNGPWFGINEDVKFSPASLLKIPLAMWYYWEADSDPGLLTQEIEFMGPPGESFVHFPPSKTLQVGETYSINELIHFMLVESDNEAANILNEFSGKDKTSLVYRDLGVTSNGETVAQTIDVRTFASFFRILYNATYLGRSLSDYMLEMMSASSFRSGIVAGVPSSVAVSHKFGEKMIDVKTAQLHDCGIIYHPHTPYLLCVMSQGNDYDELATFISAVSKMVYESVEKK
ncbi:MAG: serine hydrolase [Patescibacteria group bacterium]